MSDAIKVGFVPLASAARGILIVFCDDALKVGPTDPETIVRGVVERRRSEARSPLDDLLEDGKDLPPFDRQVSDTWRELEALANEPEEAGGDSC